MAAAPVVVEKKKMTKLCLLCLAVSVVAVIAAGVEAKSYLTSHISQHVRSFSGASHVSMANIKGNLFPLQFDIPFLNITDAHGVNAEFGNVHVDYVGTWNPLKMGEGDLFQIEADGKATFFGIPLTLPELTLRANKEKNVVTMVTRASVGLAANRTAHLSGEFSFFYDKTDKVEPKSVHLVLLLGQMPQVEVWLDWKEKEIDCIVAFREERLSLLIYPLTPEERKTKVILGGDKTSCEGIFSYEDGPKTKKVELVEGSCTFPFSGTLVAEKGMAKFTWGTGFGAELSFTPFGSVRFFFDASLGDWVGRFVGLGTAGPWTVRFAPDGIRAVDSGAANRMFYPFRSLTWDFEQLEATLDIGLYPLLVRWGKDGVQFSHGATKLAFGAFGRGRADAWVDGGYYRNFKCVKAHAWVDLQHPHLVHVETFDLYYKKEMIRGAGVYNVTSNEFTAELDIEF